MKCLLSDRLYVPEAAVSPDSLEAFTYEFDEEQTVRDGSGYSRSVMVTREVQTYKPVKGSDGNSYYGFARGNIGKLKKFFGGMEWVDKRACPPMTSELAYDYDKFPLMSWESHKRGQVEAVTDWLKRKSGIMRAPPRFGKTVSSIYILTEMRVKTLIITHQEDLLRQFYEEFENCTNLNTIKQPLQKRRDATGQIVGFFGDYDNPEELDVCLLCWQTFASKYGPDRIKKYRDTWGLSIVDECHSSGAYKYASIVNSINSKHRMGLSGTVERTDAKEVLVHDILGPVVAEGKVEEVQCLVAAIRTGIKVPFSTQERPMFLHKRLYKSQERLDLVLNYLEKDVKAGLFICVGFHSASIKQLLHFTEILQDMDIRADSFHGKTPNRTEVLAKFKSGETQVAVCNSRMLTGINVPRWNAYYSLFPTASVRIVKKQSGEFLGGNYPQWFKRITTPFIYEDGKSKQFGLIRDFIDDVQFCYATYNKRLKAYNHQGYKITNIHIAKKESKFDAE